MSKRVLPFFNATAGPDATTTRSPGGRAISFPVLDVVAIEDCVSSMVAVVIVPSLIM